MTDRRLPWPVRGSRRVRGTLAGVALVALAGTAFLVLGSQETPNDAAGPTVTVTTEPAPRTSTPSPSPSPSPSSSPVNVPVPASAPVRVQVPAVGIDARILPIVPRGGELDPPTFAEVYWIEPYGRPGEGSDNTTYLAGHSATRGRAVFDPLFDRNTQQATVSPGDEVVVTTDQGRFHYAVSETRRYVKRELDDAGEVWDKVPNRLLLITCFQRADGRQSVDNLVVFADLVRSEPLAG